MMCDLKRNIALRYLMQKSTLVVILVELKQNPASFVFVFIYLIGLYTPLAL